MGIVWGIENGRRSRLASGCVGEGRNSKNTTGLKKRVCGGDAGGERDAKVSRQQQRGREKIVRGVGAERRGTLNDRGRSKILTGF